MYLLWLNWLYLFSTIQLHPCSQHQSPWRTLSCFQVISFLLRCLWQLCWTMDILYHFCSIKDNTLRHDRKEHSNQLTSNGYHCLSAFQRILYPFSVIIIDRSEFLIDPLLIVLFSLSWLFCLSEPKCLLLQECRFLLNVNITFPVFSAKFSHLKTA